MLDYLNTLLYNASWFRTPLRLGRRPFRLGETDVLETTDGCSDWRITVANHDLIFQRLTPDGKSELTYTQGFSQPILHLEEGEWTHLLRIILADGSYELQSVDQELERTDDEDWYDYQLEYLRDLIKEAELIVEELQEDLAALAKSKIKRTLSRLTADLARTQEESEEFLRRRDEEELDLRTQDCNLAVRMTREQARRLLQGLEDELNGGSEEILLSLDKYVG